MTTIDESKTAKGYTPAALVPQVFGQPRTIEGIVIHHWGLTGQTHEGVVDFFVNGPGATSAHFVASAGKLTCLVSPLDAAWHCPGKNATHIGIECRPEATDADYATVAELVRFLRATYGDLPLSMHRDWYNTACPGVWDLARIDRLAGAAAVAPQSTTITPQEDTLSAAEADRVIKEVNAYTSALLIYGYKSGGQQHPGLVDKIDKIEGRTTPYLDAPTSAIPAKVLNQTFKLPDGTVANLSGILAALHATPITGGIAAADPAAVVRALRDQLNKK